MKKIVSLILVFITVITFVSCNNQPVESENKAENTIDPKAPITLTKENFKEYFGLDSSYGDIESDSIFGMYIENTKLNLELIPLVPGTFSNVKVTLKIYLPSGWHVKGTDSAYKGSESDKSNILESSMIISAMGTAKKTHDIITRSAWNDLEPIKEFEVISIEGTYNPQ